MLPSRILYYANIVKGECNDKAEKPCFCSFGTAEPQNRVFAALALPSRILYYAKMLQTSGMKAAFIFPSAATSYAKMLQTSGKRACSCFPSAATSYANVRKKTYNQTKFVSILSRTGYLTSSIFRAGVRHIGCRFYQRCCRLHQEKAGNKMPTAVRKMDEEPIIM